MSRLDEFDIVIRRKDGKFHVGAPQLYLRATADDLNSALEALHAKKTALEAELEENGELDRFLLAARRGRITPANLISKVSIPEEVKTFSIKTVIVVIAITAGGWILLNQAEKAIDRPLARLQASLDGFRKVGGKHFWENLEKNLDESADPKNDLPAEKKQKLLADVQVISDRWRPFITEATHIFFNTPSPDPQAALPKP